MRQRERVAELRRHLPEGAAVQDYQFEEGPRDLNAGDAPVRNVRLSELFTNTDRSLVIYHFMFGRKQIKACPMCTAWLDGAMGSRITSRKTLTSRSSQPPIFQLCAPTPARGAGTSCASLVLATAVSSTISAARTRRRSGLDYFRFHARRRWCLAPLLHSASQNGPRHSAAWHRSARLRSGTSWTSLRKAGKLVRQPCLRYQRPQRLYVGHILELFFKHGRPNWWLNLRTADIRTGSSGSIPVPRVSNLIGVAFTGMSIATGSSGFGQTGARQGGRRNYPKRWTASNLAKLRSKVPTGKCPAFLAISSTRQSEKSTADRRR